MAKVWGYFRSSAAYRLRIALNLKGISTEFEPIHLGKGEQFEKAFREVNPQQLLPVLEVAYKGNTERLIQSLAIIEFINEMHPEPPLLPDDPLARAQVRAMAQIVACDIHPLNNLRVLKYLRDPLGHDDEAVNAWYAHWVIAGFEALEAKCGDGGFCFGDAPSLADICLVPQVFNARRFNVDMAQFPRIQAIDAHLAALPAFADAHPSKQSDAE
jgi:maleylacetoacetate isomerase